MDTTTVIVLTVLITLVVVAGAWFAWRWWRSRQLKERFGPEYDRALAVKGDRSEAEKNLRERHKRVEEYDLRPLTEEERQGFASRWEDVQREFVDRPEAAVSDAHELVEIAMNARGYPVGDIRRQEEDLSVENPGVVEHYRRACVISERNRTGEATTEDLRRAMKHYREIFQSVLRSGEVEETREKRAKREVHVGR
ncbi:MAG: hypothetical protein KY397_04135 [Gemmatimonadetes bacterium]|nr:hypothetical protein [Gemmatimonadota bacterium]